MGRVLVRTEDIGVQIYFEGSGWGLLIGRRWSFLLYLTLRMRSLPINTLLYDVFPSRCTLSPTWELYQLISIL